MLQKERLPWVLVATQVLLLVLFFGCTTYQEDIGSGYSLNEYVIFRDILIMLLVGFGFLMSFLPKYGLGAVGFTMMLTALSMQLNILVELLCRYIHEPDHFEFPHPIHLTTFVDAEFAAATLLISFGAVIGRATPLQLVVYAAIQSFFYALNKVVIVLGAWKAEDVGGTITIHMFGAYLVWLLHGLLVGPSPTVLDPSQFKKNANASRVTDVLCLVGTTILWVYWPSFVGATETAEPVTEHLCVMHTVLALLGSTMATFCLSLFWTGNNFDPVHIANATLAGGVAIGASARLEMTPGGALLIGILAGAVSTWGYAFGTPFCENYLRTFDTCGVNNLHGLPSILGGIASAILVAIDDDAEFLTHGDMNQSARQIGAVVSTLAVAISSGIVTGFMMRLATLGEFAATEEYNDGMWWEGEYMDLLPQQELDLSGKSKASVSPIVITEDEANV